MHDATVQRDLAKRVELASGSLHILNSLLGTNSDAATCVLYFAINDLMLFNEHDPNPTRLNLLAELKVKIRDDMKVTHPFLVFP